MAALDRESLIVGIPNCPASDARAKASDAEASALASVD